MSTKSCFKCGEVKPLTNFYKHGGMKDGRLNKCKECNKVDVVKNRIKRIAYYREYDRNRGNRQSKEYLREYRDRYPSKYKAHCLVSNSIRSGNLFSQPCEICGHAETHAHHDDYMKPLNVRWLCAAHHKEWHKENGEGLNA